MSPIIEKKGPSALRPCVAAVPWDDVEGFLRTLFHDFRNDLNNLQIQLSVITDALCDDEKEGREAIRCIRNSVAGIEERMKQVRRRMSLPSLQIIEYPLEFLAEDLHAKLKAQTGGEWTLAWESIDNGLKTQVDPLLLGEVLVILCVEFAGKPAEHRVHAFLAGQSMRLTIPVGEEFCSSAPWTAFQKCQQDTYGLGLLFAERTIHSMGGLLTFEEDKRYFQIALPWQAS